MESGNPRKVEGAGTPRKVEGSTLPEGSGRGERIREDESGHHLGRQGGGRIWGLYSEGGDATSTYFARFATQPKGRGSDHPPARGALAPVGAVRGAF